MNKITYYLKLNEKIAKDLGGIDPLIVGFIRTLYGQGNSIIWIQNLVTKKSKRSLKPIYANTAKFMASVPHSVIEKIVFNYPSFDEAKGGEVNGKKQESTSSAGGSTAS